MIRSEEQPPRRIEPLDKALVEPIVSSAQPRQDRQAHMLFPGRLQVGQIRVAGQIGQRHAKGIGDLFTGGARLGKTRHVRRGVLNGRNLEVGIGDKEPPRTTFAKSLLPTRFDPGHLLFAKRLAGGQHHTGHSGVFPKAPAVGVKATGEGGGLEGGPHRPHARAIKILQNRYPKMDHPVPFQKDRARCPVENPRPRIVATGLTHALGGKGPDRPRRVPLQPPISVS